MALSILVNRGTYCRNTSFNYLFSQQGVGHASIATGTTPADHGIVGREWYLYLQDKIEESTEDHNKRLLEVMSITDITVPEI